MQTIGLHDVTLLFNLATCWPVPQDSKGSGLYLSLTLSLNEIVRLLVGERASQALYSCATSPVIFVMTHIFLTTERPSFIRSCLLVLILQTCPQFMFVFLLGYLYF